MYVQVNILTNLRYRYISPGIWQKRGKKPEKVSTYYLLFLQPSQ